MKHKIRNKILEKRKNLSQKESSKKSNEIIRRLSNCDLFKDSKNVLFYSNIKKEVKTEDIIKKCFKNKKIFLPIVRNKKILVSELKGRLKSGRFNIPEPEKPKPVNPKKIDLIIVPGIAFDIKGNRIGYGYGYYDKFLKETNAKKIALAYELQIVKNILNKNHDIKVDKIITEKRTIDCDKVINGEEIAQKIKDKLKKEIAKYDKKPTLAVILVGNNPASKIYVNIKQKTCQEIGINSKKQVFNENIKENELLRTIDIMNNDKEIDGILIQLPLPKHINEKKVLEKININKDVDGFNPVNVGKLLIEKEKFVPCTAKGIIKLVESVTSIEGKNAVVVGKSNIVGKPTAIMLLNRNATVTICHSKTKNLKEHTKKAEILVVAVGKPNLIKEDMVKEGAVVIDVGINKTKKGIVGDVDFDNVIKKAGHITPVPGGVGPMTVAYLMENTFIAFKHKNFSP